MSSKIKRNNVDQKTKQKVNILDQISPEEFERIEAYLHDNMEDSDRLAFEKELQENSDLKAKLEGIIQMEKDLEKAILRQKMQGFHQEIPVQTESEKPTKRLNNFYKTSWGILIGAAAVLLVFLLLNPKESYSGIYKSHFYIEPGLPTPMSSGKDYKFNEAMVDYKQKNYKIAISKWEKQLDANPQNDTLHYFIGVSYLNQKELDKALEHLNQPEIFENSAFDEDAAFYSALLFLKKKDLNQALKILENKTSPENKKLKQDLENL